MHNKTKLSATKLRLKTVTSTTKKGPYPEQLHYQKKRVDSQCFGGFKFNVVSIYTI